MAMLCTGLTTVTAAVPVFVVSTLEVALTVRAVALSPAATVRRPTALMAVPLSVAPSTDQATTWEGLFSPATSALNCWVPPLATLTDAGLMVTALLITEGVTVIAAVPLLEVSTVETARTVRLVRVSPAATVRRPEPLMMVWADLPVSTMDHVTVWSGSFSPVTTAVNCRVPPLATVAVGGLTLTPVTVGTGGGLLIFSQAARIRARAKKKPRAFRLT
jgi:hypothetical protein